MHKGVSKSVFWQRVRGTTRQKGVCSIEGGPSSTGILLLLKAHTKKKQGKKNRKRMLWLKAHTKYKKQGGKNTNDDVVDRSYKGNKTLT